MLNEAALMARLQHRHIVGMVGICQADSIMLVLELAALGPLNKYLKTHRYNCLHSGHSVVTRALLVTRLAPSALAPASV